MTRSPRTRSLKNWTYSALTEENCLRWEVTRWPRGIKKALSLHSSAVVPDDETVIYRDVFRPCSEWIITTSGFSSDRCYAHINRYKFPHPRIMWPKRPEWYRGAGFSIPGNDSGLWAAGIRRLLSISAEEAPRYGGHYLYDIGYGDHQRDGLQRWNVRFSMRQFCGHWYAEVQAFHRTDGRWEPSRRRVYWPIGKPLLGQMILYALELAYARAKHTLLPHETAEDWIIHEDGSWERKR